MFLNVAQVLLLAVLCSRMAVLLISSPTVSLSGHQKHQKVKIVADWQHLNVTKGVFIKKLHLF